MSDWSSEILPTHEAMEREFKELFTQYRYQQRLYYMAEDDGMPLPPWYTT